MALPAPYSAESPLDQVPLGLVRKPLPSTLSLFDLVKRANSLEVTKDVPEGWRTRVEALFCSGYPMMARSSGAEMKGIATPRSR